MRFLLLAASLLVSTSALAQTAQEPSKPTVPWSTAMKNEDGKPFIDHCDVAPTNAKPDGEGCVPLTLQRVAAHALYTGLADEKPDADAKFSRGILAHQIETAPPAGLDTDQSTTIKHLVGGMYPAIIVYQAFPLLFPNDSPGKIK